MKKLFTILGSVLLSVSTAFAQWTEDATQNTLISVEGQMGQVLPKAKMLPDGKMYVAWLSVENDHNYVPKLQLLDIDGKPLLEEGGIKISTHPSATYTTDWSMDVTPDGCAILTFSDSRVDPTGRHAFKPYAYKIDQQGNFLWGLDGVEIPCSNTYGMRPRVCVTNAGSVIVGYSNADEQEGGYFEMNKINADGSLAWSKNIVMPGMMGNMFPCDEDDFILVWFGGGITAQRFDSYGETYWDEPVVIESREFNGRVEPILEADGNGGVVLCYQRYVSLSEFYICVQHLSADGELMMGLQAIDTSNEIGQHTVPGLGVNTKNEEIAVFWSMKRSDDVYFKMNKFNFYGDKLWGDKGIDLEDSKWMWGWTPARALVLDDKSTILFYQEYENALDSYLYVKKVNENGEEVWKKELGSLSIKSDPQAIWNTQREETYVFWSDSRNTSSTTSDGEIYGQIINFDGEFKSDIKAPETNNDMIYYDSYNKCINIETTEDSELNLKIYNSNGLLLMEKAIKPEDGISRIHLNLERGIYIANLTNSTNNYNHKIVVK